LITLKGWLVPVSFWLRDALHAYTKRVLNTRQLQQTGLFQPNYIKQLLAFDAASVPDEDW